MPPSKLMNTGSAVPVDSAARASLAASRPATRSSTEVPSTAAGSSGLGQRQVTTATGVDASEQRIDEGIDDGVAEPLGQEVSERDVRRSRSAG
jgi:hypothetical protein